MNLPIRVALRATGSCTPNRVMRNQDFCDYVETSDEWIRSRTGIRERRIADEHETSAALGLAAARHALQGAEMEPSQIDLILCATVTPQWMTPCNANLIQGGLGCRPIPSMDIGAACTGFLYALAVGEKFIRAGSARNVLVVGAETLTQVVDFSDRNTCILFGDGAGAAILCAEEGAGTADILSINLFSDGTRHGLITVPSEVTNAPSQPEVPAAPRQPGFLRMNGREVFRFAVGRMIELIEDAQSDCKTLNRSIDLLIPHQVNQRIIDAALDNTHFPPEKVMVNLDKYGNTSAASVPIALDEAMRSGRAKPGDTLLFIAFGGGLTWGSAILTL